MSASIGVLGGTFDPIHNGHLAVASLAREALGLNKVIFVPSGNPPHKQTTLCASSHDRLCMLELALQGNDHVLIWDAELKRPGLSYTIDTLHQLQSHFSGQIHFIIGSDNLSEIHTWYKFREIIEQIVLCVVKRPGYPDLIPDELSSADIKMLPSPHWGISSTTIRNYISRGYSCRYLLPDPVIGYIFQRKLYHEPF